MALLLAAEAAVVVELDPVPAQLSRKCFGKAAGPGLNGDFSYVGPGAGTAGSGGGHGGSYLPVPVPCQGLHLPH